VFNLDNPILAKVETRRAVAHALDLKAILDVAWYGQGILSPTPISPVLTAFYDPSVKPYPYNPALAARLLDEAGYPLKAGRRFPLRAVHNPFADANVRAASYVRQALAKLGIDVTIQSYDFAGYVKAVYTDRAFDIEIENLGNSFDPTLGVQRVYWSKNFKIGLGFSNAAHYANPEVDRLLEAASVEIDEAKRRALFGDFQRIIQTDLPVLNLLSNNSYTVTKRTVRGHTVTIDGPRANFAEVYFA
jgi:peptide/nickel transport system substrate-binding protein